MCGWSVGAVAWELAAVASRLGWRVRTAWRSRAGTCYLALAWWGRRVVVRVSDHWLPWWRASVGVGTVGVAWDVRREWGRSLAGFRRLLWAVACADGLRWPQRGWALPGCSLRAVFGGV